MDLLSKEKCTDVVPSLFDYWPLLEIKLKISNTTWFQWRKAMLWIYLFFWINTLSWKCIKVSPQPFFSLQQFSMRFGANFRLSASNSLTVIPGSFLFFWNRRYLRSQSKLNTSILTSSQFFITFFTALSYIISERLGMNLTFHLLLLSVMFQYHGKCSKSSGSFTLI